MAAFVPQSFRKSSFIRSNNHLQHSRENNDDDPGEENGRSSKQFAKCHEGKTDHEEQSKEEYDIALLCPVRNPNFYCESGDGPGESSSEKGGLKKPEYVLPTTARRGKPKACSKWQNIREVVDLKNYGANELLKKIRQHSLSCGHSTERLAHCFGTALEAWKPGVVATVTWNFPPKLKICGIDLPQPGFHSAERIVETWLGKLRRFNIPFEFHAILKRCETITEDDPMIDRDGIEALIVDCVYRIRNVPDEVKTTIQSNGNPCFSPRDCVHNLTGTKIQLFCTQNPEWNFQRPIFRDSIQGGNVPFFFIIRHV
ncbi:OLC1v1031571C1 [Oldenlandia corymbosa var. corymbosa]|uniref:OLC1v1031571C1 n=1 Tax=Oldenlandia corymbosa var. corymbosa TaxID=529605 RepID=A0AAV1CKD5_OLDCO|nr:OLC1v1031571C1 [Oldenlandia corymbosa var. corymbosa]